MNIYIAHSTSINFTDELYLPLQKSILNKEHNLVFPHEKLDTPFSSKNYINNEADVVVAEVSAASMGMGIELGWANVYNTPVICIYKAGTQISQSLLMVADNFVEYTDNEDLVLGLTDVLNQM
jgi:hypothetical protein